MTLSHRSTSKRADRYEIVFYEVYILHTPQDTQGTLIARLLQKPFAEALIDALEPVWYARGKQFRIKEVTRERL
jgi:hypothetical protein